MTDGKRGKNRDEVEDAHEADWNQKWKVGQSLDYKEMPDGCRALTRWCKRLEKYLAKDDDCILSMRHKTTNIGHMTKVNSARWVNTEPCRCVIEAVNTGKQDGAANDFRNVPVNPGKHTFELGKNGRIGCTSGPSKNFWHLRYNAAAISCYDEDKKIEWPWEDLRNKPSSALRH